MGDETRARGEPNGTEVPNRTQPLPGPVENRPEVGSPPRWLTIGAWIASLDHARDRATSTGTDPWEVLRETAVAAARSLHRRFGRGRDSAAAEDLAADLVANQFAVNAAGLRAFDAAAPLYAWCVGTISHAEAEDAGRRRRLRPLDDDLPAGRTGSPGADDAESDLFARAGVGDPVRDRPTGAAPPEQAASAACDLAASATPAMQTAAGAPDPAVPSERPRSIREVDLGHCTERQRECLLAHDGAASHAEVARRLDIDPTTARELADRAKARLKKPARPPEDRAWARKLAPHLKALGRVQDTAILRAFARGLTHAATAAKLGLTRAAVRDRIHRLRRLR